MHRDPLIAGLAQRLGDGGVLCEAGDLARYERGWRYGDGKARCVARPRDTAEVAFVLQACADAGARVVAQGANTGLVGASTPDAGGGMVVLACERLQQPFALDVHNRSVLCGAGILLSDLQQRLQGHGLWFPIDLGADPQVGGMIATNTGGTRLLRHGDVRSHVLGVEVVLGDGRVVDLLAALRKNNTGLDARQLFIGSSGCFGVVTRAVLALAPLPRQRATALCACADGEAALALLAVLERELGELLSAFEVMSAAALQPVLARQQLPSPFAGGLPPYSVLVELATTLPERLLRLDEALVDGLSGHADAAGLGEVLVGEAEAFWRLRHQISEALRGEGRNLAFDVSVPRSQLPAFHRAAAELVAAQWPFARLCSYGHWGDGGSHLVLVWRDEAGERSAAELQAAMQPLLYDLAVRGFCGSFSAEHGVGPHNQRFFDRYAPPGQRQLAQALKQHCDPRGLLGTARLW